MLKVVIADDEPFVREGLKSLIEFTAIHSLNSILLKEANVFTKQNRKYKSLNLYFRFSSILLLY